MRVETEDPQNTPEEGGPLRRKAGPGWRGAVVGLLVLLCFLVPGTGRYGAVPIGHTATGAAPTDPAAPSAPSGADPERGDRSGKDDGTTALSGRVYGPDGRPAEDARVTVAGSGIWPPKEMHTDAEGVFRADDLPAGVYEVHARKEGLVAEPRSGLALAESTPVHVSLRLSPGAALTGVVIDARSGDPLEGAQVTVTEDLLSLNPRTVRTDGEGQFRVGGLQSQAHRVTATADGYVARTVEEATPGRRRLRVPLQQAATLAGVVRDHLDYPVAGALLEVVGRDVSGRPVHLTGPAHGLRPQLGEDGEGPVAPTGAGEALPVVPGPVPALPASTLAPLDHEAGGDLASDATPLDMAFRTDADGRFAIDGVPPGRIQIIARHSDHAPGITKPRRLVPGRRVEDLEITLPEGSTIDGRVVDARGQPVGRTPVQLRMEREPDPRLAVSDSDGTFAFTGVRGTLVLAALPEGQPVGRTRIDTGGGERLEVELQLPERSDALAGRTVDEHGYPVPGAQVTVRALQVGAPVERTVLSEGDGTFEVTGLPGPPYRVLARHFDYAETRLDSVDDAEVDDPLRIELRPGARVFGRVHDGFEAAPLEGAEVALRRGARTVEETHSNSSGSFEIHLVPEGNYELIVDHPDFSSRSVSTVVRASGRGLEPVDVGTIELSAGGRITGRVTDRHGDPVGGAEVALGRPPDWSAGVRADGEGNFVLDGVAPGTAHVEARHPAAGRAGSARPVVVRVKSTTENVILRLPEAYDPERGEDEGSVRSGVAVGLRDRAGAVRVGSVKPDSAAARAGLRRGDLLQAVDEEPVRSVAHAEDLLRGPEGVEAVLDIRRGGDGRRLLVRRERYFE
ncbi:MAG: carboxypeptidase regulatory-like domain-containing protein [Myxococcota bacterium]